MTFCVESLPEGLSLPDFDIAAAGKRVAEAVLESEGCPFPARVSLSLVGPEEIRELNRENRGIDRETDVLSFPMADFSSPGDFSLIREGDPGLFDLDTGELILGDIVLNMERVRTQAEEYGHSELREFSFLIAHSMLHLLGFDHENINDEEQMCARQEAVLTKLGIERGMELV